MPGAAGLFAAGSDRIRVGLIGCGSHAGSIQTHLDADPTQVEFMVMHYVFGERRLDGVD